MLVFIVDLLIAMLIVSGALYGIWITFREWLRDQETVDAVPVIRCKDCIHSTSQVSDDEDDYYCNVMMRCMHSLEYCSNGERKES